MSDTNNTSKLVRGVRSLIPKEKRRDKNLTKLPKRQAKPGNVGRSFQRVGGVSGGIASPLTETDYADRTYYDVVEIRSTDGLLVMEYLPIESISFTDAGGFPVEIILDEPPATP